MISIICFFLLFYLIIIGNDKKHWLVIHMSVSSFIIARFLRLSHPRPRQDLRDCYARLGWSQGQGSRRQPCHPEQPVARGCSCTGASRLRPSRLDGTSRQSGGRTPTLVSRPEPAQGFQRPTDVYDGGAGRAGGQPQEVAASEKGPCYQVKRAFELNSYQVVLPKGVNKCGRFTWHFHF